MCGNCTATRNRLPKSIGIFGIITFIAAPFVYSSFGILVAGALLLTSFVDLVIAWRLHVAATGFQAVRADQGFLSALSPWSGMKLSEISSR